MSDRRPTAADFGLITADDLAKIWGVTPARARSIAAAAGVKAVQGYPRDEVLRSSVRPGQGKRRDLAQGPGNEEGPAEAGPS